MFEADQPPLNAPAPARPSRQRQSRPAALFRLAAVAAVYTLYLGAYFVLGPGVFSAQHYYWHDALVIAATSGLLAWSGWCNGPPMRLFLLGNAVSMVALLVADLSYGHDQVLWRDGQGSPLQLTDTAYLVFLFTVLVAWGGLALAGVQRRRPGGRTVAVFTLLMAGIVVLFASFYGPLYQGTLSTLRGRLDVATAGLELVVVITGLAVMLLGVSHALVLQVFGLTLLAASDMLYSEATVRQQGFTGVDPVWMLGLCLLLAGAVVLPRRRRTPRGAALDGGPEGGVGRSGLSTLLLSLSLGAVLVSAVVGVALRRNAGAADDAAAAGEPFFYLLFVVALVVVMVWLTDRFDRAVHHAGRYATALLGHPLRAADWRAGERRLVWILEATGLGQLLDSLQAASQRLRQDVLFLGPERLNPAPQEPAAGADPSCFIVMPFGLTDSDAVHQVLRQACQQAGLRPVRGDDLFTPSDILDDIWRSLTGAHCVIADITGRNPNVMYELGMAHTLAKPVLILSRRADDIPIDLATRRVIVYGTADDQANAAWQATLAARTQAALEALLQAYPAGRGGAQAVAKQHGAGA
jgi:hypothetical protein